MIDWNSFIFCAISLTDFNQYFFFHSFNIARYLQISRPSWERQQNRCKKRFRFILKVQNVFCHQRFFCADKFLICFWSLHNDIKLMFVMFMHEQSVSKTFSLFATPPPITSHRSNLLEMKNMSQQWFLDRPENAS